MLQYKVQVRNPVLSEQPISKPTLKCPVKVKVNADEVEDTLNKTTTATTCTTSASKNEFFQRLWSVDDEIVILQGIMDYTTTKDSTRRWNSVSQEDCKCGQRISLKIPNLLEEIKELLIVLGDGFLLLKKIANVANVRVGIWRMGHVILSK
ncbi:hypothetical protein HYC85_027780 [Camellia sinensis]|uniref:Glabrous enhancer-binding protein-like DBD domain-containing protein n=1 Tax=Camellia sinensis TaxID=4442 RepID=A0A7J7FTJ8_CAMSI|nr:hypothetical protein HYC85_027780 [Camellia sinensis]